MKYRTVTLSNELQEFANDLANRLIEKNYFHPSSKNQVIESINIDLKKAKKGGVSDEQAEALVRKNISEVFDLFVRLN